MSDVQAVVADALRNWALMYPIPAFGLAGGEGAERLAGNWARVATGMVLEALAGAADQPDATDDEVAALRAEITTGWWEVDEPGRDQALARLDRIAERLAETDRLRSIVGLVRWLDRPMVEGLRAATASGEPYTVSLCVPGTRDLSALLDALLALTPQHRCLAAREWQPPKRDDT